MTATPYQVDETSEPGFTLLRGPEGVLCRSLTPPAAALAPTASYTFTTLAAMLNQAWQRGFDAGRAAGPEHRTTGFRVPTRIRRLR